MEVIEIARRAGSAILEIYKDSGDLDISSKSDNSPLTQADLKSNEIICEGLQNLSVHYPIISEENKAIAYTNRREYPYCWMVDPLDGTKEFIKRNGEFTTNIALIHDHRIVFGVVGVPVTGQIFWAMEGHGAYELCGDTHEKMSASIYSDKDKDLRIVCSRSHMDEGTQAFINNYDAPIAIAKGSSLKLIALANGEAEIYPRLAPTMEWDIAAAHIILQEAGGTIVQAENGLPLRYNKENLLNPYFIATGRKRKNS